MLATEAFSRVNLTMFKSPTQSLTELKTLVLFPRLWDLHLLHDKDQVHTLRKQKLFLPFLFFFFFLGWGGNHIVARHHLTLRNVTQNLFSKIRILKWCYGNNNSEKKTVTPSDACEFLHKINFTGLNVNLSEAGLLLVRVCSPHGSFG